MKGAGVVDVAEVGGCRPGGGGRRGGGGVVGRVEGGGWGGECLLWLSRRRRLWLIFGGAHIPGIRFGPRGTLKSRRNE